MIKIPDSLKAQFNGLMARNKIPQKYQIHYLKWLRYYLDYCHKYGFTASDPRSLPGFIRKLEEKKQTDEQQEQAREAIHMYYEPVRSESGYEARGPAKPPSKPEGVNEP